uniref:Uncharacterized protein n=1 Tax=Oryza sativa subsp. japonica TaxID=39947 RepID=Q69N83_ORYSJ|nr:hypothetical protein [Oryza sativa Japonica Group]BAD36234.1 hypothetical protein [Oryza sativa Japonica Group]
MDEVGGRWTFSRANEGYTSCGPVVEMSWQRDGLGTMSRLPSVYRGGMWHVVAREEDVSCGKRSFGEDVLGGVLAYTPVERL